MPSPVFGRPSLAAEREPLLAVAGGSEVSTWRAEEGSTPGITLRAVSLAGSRHRLAGQTCEDAFAWAQGADRLAVAVADGLGSIEMSAGAAQRAVAAVTGAAARGADVLEAVREAESAVEGGGATTLVMAVIRESGEIDLVQLGDSTAFVVGDDGDCRELFAPPAEDRVGTATAALPLADGEDLAEVVAVAQARMDEGNVIVLATDGIADPWRDGPSTVAPALVETLLTRPSALDLATVAGFSRQGCHDDRTLLCVWRRMFS